MMNTVSTPPTARFASANWNSYLRSDTSRIPRRIAVARALFTNSAVSPSYFSARALGRSLSRCRIISTRSSSVNISRLSGFVPTATISSSNSLAPRRITSRCPLVIGSNCPGNTPRLTTFAFAFAIHFPLSDFARVGTMIPPDPTRTQSRSPFIARRERRRAFPARRPPVDSTPVLQRRVHLHGLTYYESPLLSQLGVPHAFTTRIGGVSPTPYDSLNLGNPSGLLPDQQDSSDRIAENYRRLHRAIGCENRDRCF